MRDRHVDAKKDGTLSTFMLNSPSLKSEEPLHWWQKKEFFYCVNFYILYKPKGAEEFVLHNEKSPTSVIAVICLFPL